MKRVLKPVVALLAVLGLLSLLAAPSAASSGTITGGTLTVNLVPPIVEPLGTGISCTNSLNNITAVDDSTDPTTTPPGTPDVPSATRTGNVTVNVHTVFDYNSETFEVIIMSTGRYTSTHTATSTHNLALHFPNVVIRIYRASPGQDPCDSGTLICQIFSNSLALNGTGTFTAVHPGPIGTLHLAGSRTLSAFGCTAPFSAMNGKTATIASLTATLT